MSGTPRRYPLDWKSVSRQIRFDRAAGQCECIFVEDEE